MRYLVILLLAFAPMAKGDIIVNVPVSPFLVGPGLLNLPRAVSAQESGITITMNQGVWPLAGGRALVVQVEYSTNGGQTWVQACSADVDDVAQGGFTTPGGITIPAGEFRMSCTIPGQGQARLARVTVLVSKAHTSGAAIDLH